MATISLSHDKDDVKSTTAQITTKLSNFSLPNDTNTVKYNITNEGYDVTYSPDAGVTWTENQSNIKLKGLKEGVGYKVTITYTVNYTITYYMYNPPKEGETEGSYSQIGSTSDSLSDSDTTYVYTHPGKFEMKATKSSDSSNNIIKNVLTKEKIDDWISHYQKAYQLLL